MGCCFSKNKLKTKIVDTIDEGHEFDYLRPKGRLILKMDSIYNVPKIDVFLTIGMQIVLGFRQKLK